MVMQRAPRVIVAFVVLVSLLVGLSYAGVPQTPEQIVSAFIEEITLLSEEIRSEIIAETELGLAQIETLDGNTEPISRWFAVAQRTSVKIERLEARGDQAINRAFGRARTRFERAGGEPPQLIPAVEAFFEQKAITRELSVDARAELATTIRNLAQDVQP